MKKAPLISDFRKKISPQVGLEPTKMRQYLKKSVSNLIEGEENVLSFGYDFNDDLKGKTTHFTGFYTNSISGPKILKPARSVTQRDAIAMAILNA